MIKIGLVDAPGCAGGEFLQHLPAEIIAIALPVAEMLHGLAASSLRGLPSE